MAFVKIGFSSVSLIPIWFVLPSEIINTKSIYFYLNKIRSNKEVALLMDCSEEWVRRNIHNHVKTLAQNYTHIIRD
jgi:uncharacterized protein involved in tolerance to divalent cations